MRPEFERARIAALDSQRKAEALRESKPLTTCFVPPKRRDVVTLCDWVADNPSFKQSRAYSKLLDAYFEAVTHNCL
jgi:hypothetical protein